MKSYFSKIFIPVMLILLLSLVTVGMALNTLVRGVLKDRSMSNLETTARAITRLVQAYGEYDHLYQEDFMINLSLSAQVSGADAVILDADGDLIMCSESPLSCTHRGLTISPDYRNRVYAQGTVRSTGKLEGLYKEHRYVVATTLYDWAGYPMGMVLVSRPAAENVHLLTKITNIYLTVSVLVIIAAILLMSMLLRRQNAPLRDMARAARDFGHGQLDARVKLDSHSAVEIQELTLAFNNMASSLQKSEYQRQEFVANVSHELKTPMTTISGFVDGILDGTIPPQKQEHYMKLVSDETKRLSRLVRSMLDISKLQDQGGIPEDRKTRFDVSETAGQVLISFEQKILEKDLQVQVDMPEHPVFTRADQDAITQVLYNLVDNGVKFCENGGNLGLKIRPAGTKIYVSVSNSGQTIPPQELPLVFDRFHKLDKSRSQNREGWGLGLYIVRTLISSHGENISVSSRDGLTEFTFTLPLVN